MEFADNAAATAKLVPDTVAEQSDFEMEDNAIDNIEEIKSVASDDEDPLRDLEDAAERDDISIVGGLEDMDADTESNQPASHNPQQHLASATPTTTNGRRIYYVTIDYNQIAEETKSKANKPSLDTEHLANGRSDEDVFLGLVAHPNDIFGTLILHLMPRYGTAEIADRVNALYRCMKLNTQSTNAYTQRINNSLAMKAERLGWSKAEMEAEKARLNVGRPTGRGDALPLRHYTFLNQPDKPEPKAKKTWTQQSGAKYEARKAVGLVKAGPSSPVVASSNKGKAARRLARKPAVAAPSDNKELDSDDSGEDAAWLAKHATRPTRDPEVLALRIKLGDRKALLKRLREQKKVKRAGAEA